MTLQTGLRSPEPGSAGPAAIPSPRRRAPCSQAPPSLSWRLRRLLKTMAPASLTRRCIRGARPHFDVSRKSQDRGQNASRPAGQIDQRIVVHAAEPCDAPRAADQARAPQRHDEPKPATRIVNQEPCHGPAQASPADPFHPDRELPILVAHPRSGERRTCAMPHRVRTTTWTTAGTRAVRCASSYAPASSLRARSPWRWQPCLSHVIRDEVKAPMSVRGGAVICCPGEPRRAWTWRPSRLPCRART